MAIFNDSRTEVWNGNESVYRSRFSRRQTHFQLELCGVTSNSKSDEVYGLLGVIHDPRWQTTEIPSSHANEEQQETQWRATCNVLDVYSVVATTISQYIHNITAHVVLVVTSRNCRDSSGTQCCIIVVVVVHRPDVG